jgi:DNA processing protein
VSEACQSCLARAWLLARLSGHLDLVRDRMALVLGLDDQRLIEAVAGREAQKIRAELEAFDGDDARREAQQRGLETLCRCDPQYPSDLRELDAAPAALYIAGGRSRFIELAGGDAVAIVGARRASPYGVELARSLGRSLAITGLTVVSGMALGIDSAAHVGSLAAYGPTVAMLPGGADLPYPAAKRQLYKQIVSCGVALSELPPGTPPRRWSFPARNRLIAALAAMTIVVEAGERSGALLTAGFARSLGRALGAVPGRVTSPTATGPNALLAEGARIVRDVQDVLDTLSELGIRRPATETPKDPRAELSPELRRLLDLIAAGHAPDAAAARAGLSADQALAALASLELAGYVRREPGGAYTPTA